MQYDDIINFFFVFFNQSIHLFQIAILGDLFVKEEKLTINAIINRFSKVRTLKNGYFMKGGLRMMMVDNGGESKVKNGSKRDDVIDGQAHLKV